MHTHSLFLPGVHGIVNRKDHSRHSGNTEGDHQLCLASFMEFLPCIGTDIYMAILFLLIFSKFITLTHILPIWRL